jgi:excisionase family DNA binding protein
MKKLRDSTEGLDLVSASQEPVANEAESLGTEVGDLVRRLVCLFALPSGTKPTLRLLTAEEVADLLKTNTQVVYRLARSNQLPVVNLGQRMLRFTEASVCEFIKRGGVSRAA